jgi:hypothetical protein
MGPRARVAYTHPGYQRCFGQNPPGPARYQGILPVKCSLKHMHLWTDVYCRYDESTLEAQEIAAGRPVSRLQRELAASLEAGLARVGSRNGVSVAGVGAPEHADGSTFYRFRLAIGQQHVGEFRTRYSTGLVAHNVRLHGPAAHASAAAVVS